MLWDVIGRCPRPMAAGADMPGRISHIPGGVALNVALAVARWGMAPAILSAVGPDSEGEALIAAVADVHSLESAGELVLTPLRDGRLASGAAPWRGVAVIDGNLTMDQLSRIAHEPGLIHPQVQRRPRPHQRQR